MKKRAKKNFISNSKSFIMALLIFAASLTVYGVAEAAVVSHKPSEIAPQGPGSGLDADRLWGLTSSDMVTAAAGGWMASGGNTVKTGSGNVGIGTTAPAQKLDVVGTVKSTALQVTTGAGTGKVLTSDASGTATWKTPAIGAETDPQVGTLTSAKWCTNDGSKVNCAANSPITGVTAGTGLTGGGSSGTVSVAADTTYVQRRVSSSCSAGSSIRTINSDGTVICETDDSGVGAESDPQVGTLTSTKWCTSDGGAVNCAANSPITGVTAGAGLSGGGSSGAVSVAADTTYVQRRVSGSCAIGSYVRVIATDGTVTCGTDQTGVGAESDPQVGTLTSTKWCTSDGGAVNCAANSPITGVTAGAGLSGGGSSGAVSVAADTTYVQRRVSSSCSAGSSIRTINSDGTVICETDDTGSAPSIPSGMIAMFDASCPSGWTRFSALDGRFPLGAASYGGSGGSTSKNLDGTGGSWRPIGGYTVLGTASSIVAASGGMEWAAGSFGVLSPKISDIRPPYLGVIWCKKN